MWSQWDEGLSRLCASLACLEQGKLCHLQHLRIWAGIGFKDECKDDLEGLFPNRTLSFVPNDDTCKGDYVQTYNQDSLDVKLKFLFSSLWYDFLISMALR